MPQRSRRSIRLAMFLGFVLAGVEFLAIFMLYPVFGFLAQVNSQSFELPFIGIQIDRGWARLMAIAALGLLILRSVLTLIYRRWWLGVTASAELDLSDRLLRTYAFAPYELHLRTLSTDLMSRAVANVNLACQYGLVGIVGIASSSLLVVGLALALIAANLLAGIVITFYVGTLAAIYYIATRGVTRRLTGDLQTRIRDVYDQVSTLLRGIREVTVFGQRESYLAKITESRRAMVTTNARVSILQDIPRAVLEVTLYSTVLVAITILLSMKNVDRVLPVVALYVVAGLRIMPTLSQLLSYSASARSGTQIAHALSDEIDEIESITIRRELLVPISTTRATLTFEGVKFRYNSGGPDVLRDITFGVDFGKFVGIVGPSGSGKTTLASLVLGLLGCTEGRVRYGDEDVAVNDPFWFEKVALVPQDVFLMAESLLDNILAGALRDDEKVGRVIAMSGLIDVVAELPNGLGTMMMEGGSRLSAGQRQRVGLARALYRDPEILVLDEPTSALDERSEAHIMKSVERLRGTMTVIAIAHRTHTLAGADLVIRLAEGTIAGSGTPAEVLGV
jgi:ABC-type multidrug transport system fused ATPase/permease subunit